MRRYGRPASDTRVETRVISGHIGPSYGKMVAGSWRVDRLVRRVSQHKIV